MVKKYLSNHSVHASIGLLIIALILSIIAILQILNFNKIISGVTIAEENVSRLTKSQAQNLLQSRINNTVATFQYQDRKWQTPLESLGVEFLIAETIDKAYSIGRDQNILLSLIEEIQRLFNKQNIEISYNLNNEKFNEFFKINFSVLETPYQETSLILEKGEFKIIEGKEGIIINKLSLKQNLDRQLKNLALSPIILDFRNQEPVINIEEAQKTKQKIDALINNSITPLQLVHKDNKWQIDQISFKEWVSFEPQWNNEKQIFELAIIWNKTEIEKYLNSVLAPVANKSPQNAAFSIVNGKAKSFIISKEGWTLNAEKSAVDVANELERFIQQTENKALPSIELAVQIIEPEIKTEDIDNLGIDSLLATGESDFKGSPSNRIHNIKVGAAKYHGLIIKPGEEFSFNQILGDVDAKQGYLPELVIKSDAVIPEYGGGLCQVSTTLFRAATLAGLEILERYSHAFVVSYYGEPGFDATIYPPKPDFRFRNNTPRHILIQSRVQDSKLYFEIYGANDGRKVRLEGPIILEKQPDNAMKTLLIRKIYNNNEELISEDKFYSNYKSPSLYPIIRNPLE